MRREGDAAEGDERRGNHGLQDSGSLKSPLFPPEMFIT